MKLAGTPTGTATPTPSRSRPMSSIATHQLLSGERHRQRAFGGVQRLQPAADVGAAGAGGDLLGGQRAEQPQQVGDRLGVPGGPVGRQMLQLAAGAGDDVGVEQFAKLDAAQQLGQQRGVQRQRRRAALGQRAVALVHERPDVAEQQRSRERRRRRGLGLDARGSCGAAMSAISPASVGTS